MFVPGRPDFGTSSAATPAVFAPSVNQGEMPMVPASSPYVAPMKNSAPGLLTQTGQTLAQAGEVEARAGNTIGDRVQATMDEAQTKSAENQFLQASLPMLGQYKTTEGINATQQFDPTAQAIVKARQDARSSLTNPIQQQMFDQVTNDHVLTFGQQMADHENTQRVQYGKEQSSARADSMNVLASQAYLGGRMGDYRKYAQQADAETLNNAQLSGQAVDSDAAQAMLRAKRSALATGVITGLLDKHAYNEAGDYFQNVQGSLDLQASERLGNAIKSVTQQESAKTDGEKAVMAAQGVKGPGVLQPPVPAATISTTIGQTGNEVSGIDLHTAAGTPVHAPASGTVSKVWNDEKNGGGLTVEMQMPGGYTAAFNHLSAANYEAGQKITIGQVLGLSGKDDGGQGVVNYSMADGDGKPVDPRQASTAPLNPSSFNTPQLEEKAVDWINANVADPDERKQAEGYVRGIASTNRQIENQENAAAMKQAVDYSLQNGGSIDGLPADVKMKLTTEQLQSIHLGFLEKNEQMYHLGQDFKDRGEVGQLADWNAAPASRTVDAVRQAYAQGKLSDQSYQTALKEATTLQDKPEKVMQATMDHDQLTNILSLNQMPSLAEPKTAQDKLGRVQLEEAIKSEIDSQQQRNNRPLTFQEKGKIARDMTIDKVYTSGMLSTNSGLKPVAITTPAEQQKATVWIGNQPVRMMDIPAQQAVKARQDLQSSGVPSTQANIAAWWVRQGRPKQ